MQCASDNAAGGFTLFEIAIVLVVIGLLTGGILVGRDLIHAAQIRATVKQFEEFNGAANAFRMKYNCLPGDCPDAGLAGFDPITRGNGDLRIGGCNYGPDCLDGTYLAAVRHEHVDFWHHLSASGLIGNAIPPYASWPMGASDIAGVTTPPARVSAYSALQSGGLSFPSGWAVKADIQFTRSTTGLLPSNDGLPAHVLLLGVQAVPDGGSSNVGQFKVGDVFALDRKLDDGLPLSGAARVWMYATATSDFDGLSAYISQTGSGQGYCATAGSPTAYNIGHAETTCGLAVKASF